MNSPWKICAIVSITSLFILGDSNPAWTQSIPKTIERVEVSGNTVISSDEIKAIVVNYEGKELSWERLRQLTDLLTQLYVSRGYLTSGAFLPQQDISNGVIKVRIVEGRLEKINIEGLKHLNKSYITSIFTDDRSQPLNINSLEEKLRLIQQNSSIENIQAELIKGTTEDKSVLLLEIEEATQLNAKLSFDNYRSPNVGEYQGTVQTSYQNLIGVSDRAWAEYNLTEGFDAYLLNYTIPINRSNGTISLEYRNGDSKILEDLFDESDIRAEADTISLQYRQPIIYRSFREVALGIALERQASQTFILDKLPFSFTTGPQEGRSVVSELRLKGEWLERFPTAVLAVNSQLNFGLDLFNATVNDDAPDGLFFIWQGQAQWIQALNQNRDLLLISRLAIQLTPDSLLPLSQFTLGGFGTVRGYRQNQEVGDNGVVGTIEIQIPLAGNGASSSKLNLIPFIEGGKVWNSDGGNSSYLASVGYGLSWEFKDFLSIRIDWGLPLTNNSTGGNSLQENGFSFSFQLQPF